MDKKNILIVGLASVIAVGTIGYMNQPANYRYENPFSASRKHEKYSYNPGAFGPTKNEPSFLDRLLNDPRAISKRAHTTINKAEPQIETQKIEPQKDYFDYYDLVGEILESERDIHTDMKKLESLLESIAKNAQVDQFYAINLEVGSTLGKLIIPAEKPKMHFSTYDGGALIGIHRDGYTDKGNTISIIYNSDNIKILIYNSLTEQQSPFQPFDLVISEKGVAIDDFLDVIQNREPKVLMLLSEVNLVPFADLYRKLRKAHEWISQLPKTSGPINEIIKMFFSEPGKAGIGKS